MSGHSKWSSIKHKKAAQDHKRGKLFTKLIREITVAAREGGGDADANPRLRAAITDAQNSNMPKDTIQRAVDRGSGNAEDANYEAVTYEGYGPANVAVIVEALTDNRNRTVASVRKAFSKYGGSLGSPNAVAFMFDRKGALTLPKDAVDEDTLTEYLVEAGGDDFSDDGDTWFVTCAPEQFEAVRRFLEEQGVTIERAELAHVPQTRVKLEDAEDARRVLAFLDTLEDDDDVQKVFSNFDMDESLWRELAS